MAKHHYLAQCYLKGFATPRDRKAIWQYQRSTCILRKRGINNVAYRRNYYYRHLEGGALDGSAERFFGLFESQWPSLRLLLDHYVESAITNRSVVRSPSAIQRTALLQFMFIHFIRTPEQLDWFREHVRSNHPQGGDLTELEVQDIVIPALASAHDDLVDKWVASNGEKSILIIATPAGSRRHFFTTDKPVIIPDDIRKESTPIYFPASRRMVIGFEKAERGEVRVLILRDTDNVDKANTDLIMNAPDEIYAKEPLYLKEILEKSGFRVELRESANDSIRAD